MIRDFDKWVHEMLPVWMSPHMKTEIVSHICKPNNAISDVFELGRTMRPPIVDSEHLPVTSVRRIIYELGAEYGRQMGWVIEIIEGSPESWAAFDRLREMIDREMAKMIIGGENA